MPIKSNKIKRILVCRNDRFGEFLLNIPAFQALKKRYPDSIITLIVDPVTLELAKAVPCVDEIILWSNAPKHTFQEKLALFNKLKKGKFDLALIFNPSKEINLLCFLAGIPLRGGYDKKWGFLLTHKLKDLKHLEEKHEIEYNLELAGIFGASVDNHEFVIDIPHQVEGFVGNWVAVHPWTSDLVKQWPFENFHNLIKKLLLLNLKVVVIGGKQEAQNSKIFLDSLPDEVNNLAGKTTLLELAAVLKSSRLLISGDSGPVHLARVMKTPVVAIFRNDLPGKTAKRWGPDPERSIVLEADNLGKITVDDVFNKIASLLRSSQ